MAIASQWDQAAAVDPTLMDCRAHGRWWDVLEEAGATLLVTREYEHLVLALAVERGRPRISFMRLPHPSGLVVDRGQGRAMIASTRCPNQIFEFRPARDWAQRPLLPNSSSFYPGSLYLHDLALVGADLYANAVGQNAVVRIASNGRFERAWWPRCIESRGRRKFDRNYLQLNSIAAGRTLKSSYFSASCDRVSSRRPGHRNFPVDRRGVIFSGATREPIARGLTRPHSARLHGQRVWVDNSGYGEVGYVDSGRLEVVARLPGWTRGLCFMRKVAFVGTSRIIPRFENYAPGLTPAKTVCGLHAIDVNTGRTLGSLTWPLGNQIFGIDWISSKESLGFPFQAGRTLTRERVIEQFYRYSMRD